MKDFNMKLTEQDVILSRHDSERIWRGVRTKLHARRRRDRAILRGSVAAAAIAAVTLGILPFLPVGNDEEPSPEMKVAMWLVDDMDYTLQLVSDNPIPTLFTGNDLLPESDSTTEPLIPDLYMFESASISWNLFTQSDAIVESTETSVESVKQP